MVIVQQLCFYFSLCVYFKGQFAAYMNLFPNSSNTVQARQKSLLRLAD